MDLNELLKKLREYYDTNCKKLVFLNEKKLSTNSNCKMYYLDILEQQELLNYKKLFQEYLVFYIRNRDQLLLLNSINDANLSDLSNVLQTEGKRVRNDKGIYPQTDEKRSGIYGELFDDFYLNIVKKEEVLLTYALKESFNEPNAKGVDVVATDIVDGEQIMIFSEAKFVVNISSASSSLVDDIIGNDVQLGHVTKDYINKYTSFLLNRGHSIFFDDKKGELINTNINNLNYLLLNNDMLPIDAINQLNIRIRFDFFAIYSDNNQNIEERQEYYNKILKACNDNIASTGLLKYDIEIIFIPTKNTSVDLKRVMETWD